MRTHIKAAVIVTFVLLWAGAYLYQSLTTDAQNRDEPYLSANQQKDQFPSNLNLDCTGCHGPGKTIPFLAGEKFHKDSHSAYETSVHGRPDSNGKTAASCLDCHALNGDMTTVFRAEDPRSTVNRANMPQTCGKCHQDFEASFQISIHGDKREHGDLKAASCADCHGSHSITSGKDTGSAVNRINAAEAVCIKCHTENVGEWETSSHGVALRAGNPKAPSCTTCHTAVSHLKAPLSLRDFNVQMVNTCSSCHENQAPSYRDTFHGQATALDFKMAASCADCHTPHHNLPKDDPRSSVNKMNLVQTCSACHTGVNANFVTFDPHPEPHNPEKSQLVYYVTLFMEWLLLGVFSFFGIHTLLWLQRSLVAYFSEVHEHSPDDDIYVIRFAKVHRITHILIVISFILLAATGLPLMYYYTNWAQFIENLFGGLETMRIIHRICAVITLAYAVIHVVFIFRRAVIERKFSILYGPESMVPRWQDVVDLFNMVRWFFYLGPRPKLDRWTYWEKFDYFAVFWGVPVIGLSGLVLWFPTFFTRFLPGEFLNVAMIVHGEEALLATAFIFAFHFFHNHLRPENFPMDIVMFTGKMTLSRFKEERPAEYDRLLAEDKLDTIIVEPPSRRARILSKVFGFIAYISGLLMVAAILLTLIIY